MKKSIFILATAALVLASCNNDVKIAENKTLGNEPQEIGLFPVTQNVKRIMGRAPIYGNTFPAQDMYVAAYMAAPNAGNYFEKTTYKKNYAGGVELGDGDKDGVWGGDPARYYPLSAATINFLAITGAGINESHFAFGATNYASSATVAYTTGNSYSSATQSDILYAVGQGVVSQSNNTLTFAGGGTTSGENIAMEFKHALALLNFQVKANSPTEINKIKVNSITIHGASYTGNLTVTNANYNSTSSVLTQPTIAWAPSPAVDAVVAGTSSCPFPYTLSDKDNYYPTDNNADANTWWSIMIVPSNTGVSPTERGFMSFTINYTVSGNPGQADQTYDYTYYPSNTEGTPINVAEGKIYTYKINFKLHEIRIEPSVTDWSVADGYPKVFDVQ